MILFIFPVISTEMFAVTFVYQFTDTGSVFREVFSREFSIPLTKTNQLGGHFAIFHLVHS